MIYETDTKRAAELHRLMTIDPAVQRIEEARRHETIVKLANENVIRAEANLRSAKRLLVIGYVVFVLALIVFLLNLTRIIMKMM